MNRSSRTRTSSIGLRCTGFGVLLLATTPLSAQSPRAAMPDSVRGYIREAMTAQGASVPLATVRAALPLMPGVRPLQTLS